MQTVNKAVLVVTALLWIGGISCTMPVEAQNGPSRLFLPFTTKVDTPTGGSIVDAEEPVPIIELIDTGSPTGPVIRPNPDIVRLPLYTEEELAQIRGLPLNPGDPDTRYLPPGYESLDQLPICPPRTEDDPSTPDIHEGYQEYLRGLFDGTADRNAQSRVMSCQVGVVPDSGISLPPDEFREWWLENGQPISPDPRTE